MARPPFLLFFLLSLLAGCSPAEEETSTQFPGKPETPAAIRVEHAYLLAKIHEMTLLDDSTGRAAKRLEELMVHHFQEEEDYVLPPLGLLPALAGDSLPENSRDIIQLTDKLKSQQVHLNVEHQMIKAIMGEMVQAAAEEHHPEVATFEKELLRHAQMEEEILFPAAILVGEYLKMKLPPESD